MTRGHHPPDLRLIVITDERLAAPRSVEDVVREALEAGAPAVQLRAKHLNPSEIFPLAVRLRRLTRDHDALLFINDRLDVALAADADGVHLGPDDLPVAPARRAAEHGPRRLLIGYSADDPGAAREAEAAGADYIGCGAVFGTTSKPEVGDERIGLERLAEVARAVEIPVVGIGGITPANAARVRATGAAGIAAIGSIMAASDVSAAVLALLEPSGSEKP